MSRSGGENLEDFFVERFSPRELRRFISNLHDGDVLRAALPGESATMDVLAHEVVGLLRRHGVCDDDFWKKLKSTRKVFTDQIAEIQANFPPIAFASSPTLSLLLARASQRESHTEIEIVVRNNSTRPQLLKELHLEAQNLAVDYSPRFELKSALTGDHLVISIENDGWSDLSLDLDVRLDSPSPDPSPRIVSPRVRSGEKRTLAAFSEADLFRNERNDWATIDVFGSFHAHQTDHTFQSGRHFSVSRREFLAPDISAAMAILPDTTYACIFETTAPSCQKRYPILREVPAGKLDVFSCLVSADRSASFDMLITLVSADEATLSTPYERVSVARRPADHREYQDGDVFTVDKNGSWHLNSRFRRPSIHNIKRPRPRLRS